MIAIRRRLRVLATAWILFQATSLSALVPRACCLAHQAHRASSNEKKTNCHEHAQRSIPADQEPDRECAIRGTCGGPAAALFAVLSNYGVLTSSFSGLTYLPLTGATLSPRDQLIRQFASPDAPPPRA